MMFTQLDAPCLKQDVLGKQKRYIARICVSFARTVGRSLDSGRAFAGKENLAKLEKFVRSLIGRGEARTYSSRRQRSNAFARQPFLPLREARDCLHASKR